MFLKSEHIDAVKTMADVHNVPYAFLAAVVEVESGGKIFADVNGTAQPLIRFEGHYFDRLVPRHLQAAARQQGLASPKVGGVKNPRSQAARYLMLGRAMKLDAEAAISSCSWGIGQVMGSHWKRLGFSSAAALKARAQSGFDGQLDLMMRYVQRFDLLDEMQRGDIHGFARGYNGPLYAKWGYHTKIEAAIKRHKGGTVSKANGMLRMGSKGQKVRELQILLNRAGFSVVVDGDFGRATKDAVKSFQSSKRLEVDGVVGAQTMKALMLYRQGSDEALGEVKAADTSEVKQAAAPAGFAALLVGVRDELATVAGALTDTGSETAETIANVILAGGALIGVALAAYAMWGLIKRNKTTGLQA